MHHILSVLREKYDSLEVDQTILHKIYQFAKRRQQAYKSLNETIDQQLIVDECLAYLELFSKTLLNTQSASNFHDLLTLTDSIVPETKYMSEETKSLITQKRYETLRGVLKTLKQHPHKAGIKIRFLKDNISEMQQ